MLRVLIVAVTIPIGLDLYLPTPEGNPLTVEKVELGRRLFNDRRLSRDGTIACASCHDPAHAFADGRVKPIGIDSRVGRRHAPALVNRGYGRAFFWDARVGTLEAQVLKPIEDPNEMDSPVDAAAARVGLDRVALSQALASYVRSILSGDAPYDRFTNGQPGALSLKQQEGLQIFRGKANCTACHLGPNFSDERLHNTGVAWVDDSGRAGEAGRLGGAGRAGEAGRAENGGSGDEAWRYADEGRASVTGNAEELGAFKTPTLREVARTAPYMHDGSLPTLEDVIDFYDRGGRPNPHLDVAIRPLHLTTDEKSAVAAFLRALSGVLVDGAK